MGLVTTAQMVEAYLAALQQVLEPEVGFSEFRKVCGYYHANHALVEALRDHGHPAHDDQWLFWTQRVVAILCKLRMNWSSDAAVDVDDLNQKAQFALFTSLPSFNYQSSLDTWVRSVVVNTINRYVRDSLAQKRAQRPESLDGLPDGDLSDEDTNDDPAQSMLNQILVDQTREILFEYGGQRLVLMFFWHTMKLHTTTEIAQMVNLHPSRVRALLKDARQMLRDHPLMRAWR
ncbi:sigma-70 family RNA polymerase sigma factor [Candidatus Oscillochloris fontis]|uniref:sigma-70 family RNA polymerase sigma factor n=1 Tax=Candidatus Oscillochloris fontis TaxID=2496868 RepID=UPI00101CA9E2|nr:sigma-70 family RNA polymerase sigma factor [Candidatus Oscillochloris fontis]